MNPQILAFRDSKKFGVVWCTQPIRYSPRVVPPPSDEHDGVSAEKVEGVERADVVEDVGVSVPHHEEEHREIEAPEHLHDPKPAKVLAEKEERKVAEASHPDVARDHHAHRVVDFFRVEVVVQQEHELHPTLRYQNRQKLKNTSRCVGGAAVVQTDTHYEQ